MAKRKEGQWNRNVYKQGVDSSLHGIHHNNNTLHINTLMTGSVELARTEPLYRQNSVDVQLTKGGALSSVAWPGGQVNASSSGVTSPVTEQIHGLWEAPLPGQQVLIGFVNGDNNDPIVLNKYPYNALQDPIYESAHNQPLTQKNHGSLDIVLGHFTGSFIAHRGTLPLPGHIDINSVTSMTVESVLDLKFKSSIGNAQVTLNSSGLVGILNTTGSLKTIIGDLIDAVSGLTTFGSPPAHTVTPASQAILTAIKVRANLILGDT